MSENFKPKSSGWVMNHFGITRGKLDKYDELISPDTRSDQQYNKNKYREYRYEDIEKMWYIHMLSQMGMQMKEINELVQQDEIVFREAVIQRIEDLEAEKRRIEGMISIAKMCRVTGRIPLPKDFATIPFADYREAVLQKWSSDHSSESKLMMALADYRLETLQSNSDTDGKEVQLTDLSENDLQELSKLDIMTIIEMAAAEQQLARLFPTDITSKEVLETVKTYCACAQEMSGEDDYPLNRVADHLSSQFYDGDGSVELIRKYGKERQEYMASAFEYFAQNT
jgi:DNA-binding transcriptional MerR regulator